MKRKNIALILVIVLLLSLAACGSGSTNETTAATHPTASTGGELRTYPLNVDSAYADYAVSLPKVIFNTTGEENGLIGNIYSFEGVLRGFNIYKDETNTYTFYDARIMTDGGIVKITNIYRSIYDASVNSLGEDVTQLFYKDDINDYIFPQEGETARFIVTYGGYSGSNELPTFYLGASPSLYEMLSLYDPIAKIDWASSENQYPTEPESTTAATIEPTSATTAATEPPATKPPQTTPTAPPATDPPATEPPATDPPATEPTSAGPTAGEKNALRSADQYLSVIPFSYQGLIKQLEYEGYSTSEATYAADNCGADWNEQALKKATDYLESMPFSYKGLIKQLEYEKFTKSQATYGADNCGADWNEQAVKAAENYLSFMSFSRSGLIDQLEYEGFTHEQAVYGVEANGL